MLLRIVAPVIVVLALLGTPACGDEDLQDAGEQAQQEFREGIERARDEFEERRARLGQRIREVLGDLEKVVPRAQRTSPTVRSRGRDEATTIDAFMTELLQDIDGYWTTTFEAAGLPTPQVRYLWIEPGAVVLSGCGEPAGDRAAFYCPADDTIYVAQQFAADLYQGVAEGLPGQSAGFGRATGDFAVAYVLAHEYAHNLQHELGVFDNRVAASAKPFELQADCMAGTWAHSVYEQGLLKPEDLQEATDAALALGDFDIGNAQHHGTPPERRDALLAGFRSGEPSICGRFVPATA
ncbi:MAG TPA: neutral zinc metallopeptidase [Solirubrobacteraceae bacterium]|nr:neutral zinc metallopeptidase [Solirubrobacteraceae bacterium]